MNAWPDDLGPYPAPCERCGEPIRRYEQPTAVMVNEWVPRLQRYVARGPFHGTCARPGGQPKTPPVPKNA